MADGDYAIEPWRTDGWTTLTATGLGAAEVLAAGLAGVLVAARGEPAVSGSADDAKVALPLRAEAPDIAALFDGLAAALLDITDDGDDDVVDVQIDGVLRTDLGLVGWGYALAAAGPGAARGQLTLEPSAPSVDADGRLRLRVSLRRVARRS